MPPGGFGTRPWACETRYPEHEEADSPDDVDYDWWKDATAESPGG
jgi:hypothetical protein